MSKNAHSPSAEDLSVEELFKLNCTLAKDLAIAALGHTQIKDSIDHPKYDACFYAAINRAKWITERLSCTLKTRTETYRLFRPGETMTPQDTERILKNAKCPDMARTTLIAFLQDLAKIKKSFTPIPQTGPNYKNSPRLRQNLMHKSIEEALVNYCYCKQGDVIANDEFEDAKVAGSTKNLVRPYETFLVALILLKQGKIDKKYEKSLEFDAPFNMIVSPPVDYYPAVINQANEGIALRTLFPEFYDSSRKLYHDIVEDRKPT